MEYEIRCNKCDGYGKVVLTTESNTMVDCPNCKGTGKIKIEIPKVKFGSKCPHCDKPINMQTYIELAMNLLQGKAQDLTNWIDEVPHKFGIDAMNTRFVETEWTGEPRIELFNTYFERWRVGNYHGYWKREEVEKIIVYLQDWLKRIKNENIEVKK